jgi:hypothetical protein
MSLFANAVEQQPTNLAFREEGLPAKHANSWKTTTIAPIGKITLIR